MQRWETVSAFSYSIRDDVVNGEKRNKEECLEMLESPDKRSKEMWGFRNARRGRIKQGSYGREQQPDE